MVDAVAVTLPAGAFPPEVPAGDPVLAAACRALGAGERSSRARWSWVSATLSEPQLRALGEWLGGLPLADTVSVRLAREDALSRLGSALAGIGD